MGDDQGLDCEMEDLITLLDESLVSRIFCNPLEDQVMGVFIEPWEREAR